MTLTQAINILEKHNKWRLGGKDNPIDPKQLTEALEVAINLLKQLNKQQ